MKYTPDLIEKMKQMHYEHDGTILSDLEAEQAWDNLCEYFRILYEWDRMDKEKNDCPAHPPAGI